MNGGDLAPLARRARSERDAALLLERNDHVAVERAVESVLRRCGAGCTDLSTATIVRDPALLRGVLILHTLDEAVTEDRRPLAVGD